MVINIIEISPFKKKQDSYHLIMILYYLIYVFWRESRICTHPLLLQCNSSDFARWVCGLL